MHHTVIVCGRKNPGTALIVARSFLIKDVFLFLSVFWDCHFCVLIDEMLE